jgi:hypothetical protein
VCRTRCIHNGVDFTMRTEMLARERTRSNLQEAEQLRYSRRMRALRRANRVEHRAERRMVDAWRRTAELRSALETADY